MIRLFFILLLIPSIVFADCVNMAICNVDGGGNAECGTCTIGAAGDYATLALAEADMAAQLAGDLTFSHLAEETAIAAYVEIDVDTNGHTWTLTATEANRHDGKWNAAKAQINFGTYDSIDLEETTAGWLDDAVVEYIQFNLAGAGNQGVRLQNGGDSGNLVIRNNIFKGDGSSEGSISTAVGAVNNQIYNNVIYDATKAGKAAIYLTDVYGNKTNTFIANNTILNCTIGIWQSEATAGDGDNYIMKNNLLQDCGTSFVDDGGGYGTTAKNITDDASGPDAAYDDTDVVTDSIFENYGADNYTLDSGGDATNLAIADDGENLYGSGVIDDIESVSRVNGTPFWIGASHIVAAGGQSVVPIMMQFYDTMEDVGGGKGGLN